MHLGAYNQNFHQRYVSRSSYPKPSKFLSNKASHVQQYLRIQIQHNGF